MYKKFKFLFVIFLLTFHICYTNISESYQCGPTQSKKSKNSSLYYEYDNFDRVISKNYANGRIVQYKYNNLGQCIQVIDNDKKSSYEYDIFGNISKITYPNLDSLQYLYDAFGKLLKITYPDSSEVYYFYDLSDRLIAVKDSSGTCKYEYDERSNKLKKIILPNGVSTDIIYNNSRRISEVIHKNNDGSLIEKHLSN